MVSFNTNYFVSNIFVKFKIMTATVARVSIPFKDRKSRLEAENKKTCEF
jgi:hypothetical protein